MNTGCKLLAVLLASLFLFTLIPGEASAFPYKIEGYLKDSRGIPIPLANVTISGDVYDMGVQDMVTRSWNRTTNEHGYYVIHLAADEPGGLFMGSTVTVSYDSGTETTSTTLKIEGLSGWANLTYEKKPGLGDYIVSPMGIVTSVIAVTASVMIYLLLKRDVQDDTPRKPTEKVEQRRRK